MSAQEQAGHGWIEWKGGECPVAPDVLVDVQFRDGKNFPVERAVDRDWIHVQSDPRYGRSIDRDSDSDIVAYRVVQS